MRPAPWPPPRHKCARDPALPYGPRSRPLCTSVQRWDPALPRAPVGSSCGHDCAATGAHAVGHAREPGASMERVAGQIVSHGAQRPDERLPREKGRPAPFLLAGVQGQRPAGVQGQRPAGGAGGKAPAGVQGQRPARYHPPPRSPRPFIGAASSSVRPSPAGTAGAAQPLRGARCVRPSISAGRADVVITSARHGACEGPGHDEPCCRVDRSPRREDLPDN
jgi:hypothetical protein